MDRPNVFLTPPRGFLGCLGDVNPHKFVCAVNRHFDVNGDLSAIRRFLAFRPSLTIHLDFATLNQLRELEPYLRQFDLPIEELTLQNGPNFNMREEFTKFQRMECKLW